MIFFNILTGIALIVCSVLTLIEYLADCRRAYLLRKMTRNRSKYRAEMKPYALIIWGMMIAYAILNYIF